VIGASWATLFLTKGYKVICTDVNPAAEAELYAYVQQNWEAAARLGLAPGACISNLAFTLNMEEAAAQADFIQEVSSYSFPECSYPVGMLTSGLPVRVEWAGRCQIQEIHLRQTGCGHSGTHRYRLFIFRTPFLYLCLISLCGTWSHLDRTSLQPTPYRSPS
jgi:hypothetical protein